MSDICFHCHQTIPSGTQLSVLIEQVSQPMCCLGCQAVAQTIVDNNLHDYYRYRTEPSEKATPLIPESLTKNEILDDQYLQDEFVNENAEQKETILSVDGITCAACAWLIEQQVQKMAGVNNISVNATTQRATVNWQKNTIKLSEILNKIQAIGYHALPFKANDVEIRNQQQSRAFIKRLGVSGILTMQIMMIATALYFGAFTAIEEHQSIYLRWVSLCLATPIIFYGALPFYKGAISALKSKALTMDVPVSIAILLAFSASVWATVTQQGEVYFESISMFTFLLLIGKFLEFRARSRAAEMSANLLKQMPLSARQLVNNVPVQIPAKKLKPNDLVLIQPGESISGDGVIVSGNSEINEAMLTGEQLPIKKQIGDQVFAGTTNGDGNLVIKITQPISDSFLSQLIRLSEQSQAHKPQLAKLSDKIAQYFVAVILCCSLITYLYWHAILPEEAFWITLSVLVATCPCALSLATPTALTSAVIRLNNQGIMIKSAHVLETFPTISHIAFDKTGTLTQGEFSISSVKSFTEDFSEPQLLALAAALEQHSEHPIAKAFIQYNNTQLTVENIEVISGCGVQGQYKEQNIAVGKAAWLMPKLDSQHLAYQAQCVMVLNNKLIAIFYLKDNIREDASKVIAELKQVKLSPLIITGDNPLDTERVANLLAIDEKYSAQSAQQKLSIIQKKQAQGHILAMVGDGVNDSPVFGAAHISIAMGSGTDIAKTNADVILLNNQLTSVSLLFNLAVKTKRIIIENYIWAFGYNALILPLAMSGHITPYWAVIGMSASSLLVVSNSLRLLKK